MPRLIHLRSIFCVGFGLVLAVVGGVLANHFVGKFAQVIFGPKLILNSLFPVDCQSLNGCAYLCGAVFFATAPWVLIIYTPFRRDILSGLAYVGLEALCSLVVAFYYAQTFRAAASIIAATTQNECVMLPATWPSMVPLLQVFLSGPLVVCVLALSLRYKSRTQSLATLALLLTA